MEKKSGTPAPPLEAGLLTAMRAVDNQVARAMQRTPEELSKHGVQKWEPYQQRIETITSFILDSVGAQQVELDSLLVLSQAFTKALTLLVNDLDEKGLGHVRSEYCRAAFSCIIQDAQRGLDSLSNLPENNLM